LDLASRELEACAVAPIKSPMSPNRTGGLRLIGPEIEILERDGSRRLVRPYDVGFSALWARLPESERRWEPSWGFHPDDDPEPDLDF
jgi:hypothetical protein